MTSRFLFKSRASWIESLKFESNQYQIAWYLNRIAQCLNRIFVAIQIAIESNRHLISPITGWERHRSNQYNIYIHIAPVGAQKKQYAFIVPGTWLDFNQWDFSISDDNNKWLWSQTLTSGSSGHSQINFQLTVQLSDPSVFFQISFSSQRFVLLLHLQLLFFTCWTDIT